MESEAVDIINRFTSAKGISLIGRSLQNCQKFAYVIMLMERESKLSKPSVRNCQKYAEDRVDAEHRISHATFYNDDHLNAMLNWYISTKKEGNNAKEELEKIKDLESIIRRQKKQIQGLVASQQMFDSIDAELHRVKLALIKQRILFKRAMSALKNCGRDFEVDMSVSIDDIGIESEEAYTYFFPEKDRGALEQGNLSELDVQDI